MVFASLCFFSLIVCFLIHFQQYFSYMWPPVHLTMLLSRLLSGFPHYSCKKQWPGVKEEVIQLQGLSSILGKNYCLIFAKYHHVTSLVPITSPAFYQLGFTGLLVLSKRVQVFPSSTIFVACYR